MAGKPKFITITGRPLSGKSGIIKKLLALRPDFEIFRGKSFTTRPPRGGDVPHEYEHVSAWEFARLEAEGEFAWIFPHGDYLVGTRTRDIVTAESGERVSVMTLVPQAVGKLISVVGSEKVMPFFIECSEADTYRRLPDRKDDAQKTLERLRETSKWKMELLGQQVLPTFVRNPNEEDQCSTAMNTIISALERRGL